MAYDRERALRLVLGAVRPHLDKIRNPTSAQISVSETVEAVMIAMNDEPQFGLAFDAAVKAVWDAAQYFALNPE